MCNGCSDAQWALSNSHEALNRIDELTVEIEKLKAELKGK